MGGGGARVGLGGGLRERGTAVVLVSHAMTEVEQFCHQAILLHQGILDFHGNANEAVKHYYLIEQQEQSVATVIRPTETRLAEVVAASNQRAFFWPQSEARLDISNAAQVANGWARCTAVAICNEHFQPCHVFQQGETARFYYEFEILHDVEVPIGGVLIQSDKGVHVHGKSTLEYGTDIPKSIIRGSRIRFQQDIALDIAVGEYTFEVGLAAVSCYDFENRTRYSHPELHER